MNRKEKLEEFKARAERIELMTLPEFTVFMVEIVAFMLDIAEELIHNEPLNPK